ncbi:MAG: carboxypeptidase-like regulatory domain-containing protein, partial [Sphingobacteriaceae bacterium]|nr:carboxypeptidase-like regulatory domain-containing protein [Sphingobacteriaceae bacterium]
MRFSLLLLFFLLLASSAQVFAQITKPELYNVNYNQAKISEVVADLEGKTEYHFYYDENSTDSLRITFTTNQKKIDYILEQIFNNTGFYFVLMGKDVFITKGKPIRAALTEGYYSGNTKPNQAGYNVQELDNLQQEKQISVTTENKIYEIGLKINESKSGSATLVGYLRDIKSGEPIVGASIADSSSKINAMSDQFGFYAITLPYGKHILSIKAAGRMDTKRQVILHA